MDLLVILNAFVVFSICISLTIGFFRLLSKRDRNSIRYSYGLLALGYCSILILYILWIFNITVYTLFDYELLFSLLIFLQTVILFYMVHALTLQRSLFYWFFFYLCAFLFTFIAGNSFGFLLLTISYLLTLYVCISLISYVYSYRSFALRGISYSIISLLGLLLSFMYPQYYLVFTFISHLCFFIFLIAFIRALEPMPLGARKKRIPNESKLLLFIKYFAFIIIIVTLVFISTIAIHELGHVVVARYYSCESRAIVYENGRYPYSEIICTGLAGKVPISLAGPLLPVLVACILFFLGSILRHFSYLIIGFNLLASYMDLKDIGVSDNILFVLSFIGIIFICIGLTYLARARVEESFTELNRLEY